MAGDSGPARRRQYGRDGVPQTGVGLAPAVRRHPDWFPAIVVFPQSPPDGTPGFQARGERIALAALDRSLAEFHGAVARGKPIVFARLQKPTMLSARARRGAPFKSRRAAMAVAATLGPQTRVARCRTRMRQGRRQVILKSVPVVLGPLGRRLTRA